MRLIYEDLRSAVATRFGTPEAVEGVAYIEGTIDLPLYQKEFLDRVLLRVVHDILREVPRSEIESIGPNAIEEYDLADGAPFPPLGQGNASRILSSAIYTHSGTWVNQGPGEVVSENEWFQRSQSDDDTYVWSVVGGKAHVKADYVVLMVGREPTMSDLKGNSVLVPDGSDRDIIERAVRWLKFADDMQQGRA